MSNNNLGGWSTGVAVLPLVMILVIILAISGNLIGLVSKSRFWGSVQAGWLLVSFAKPASRLLKLFSTLSNRMFVGVHAYLYTWLVFLAFLL